MARLLGHYRWLHSAGGSFQPTCPYVLLGLPRTATATEVKRRYYEEQLSLVHHPDRQISGRDKAAALEEFLAIKTAYETLLNPETRRALDSRDVGLSRDESSLAGAPEENVNNFRVVAPWFYGLFGIGALVLGLGVTISEKRGRATDEAWERYAEKRTQEGLAKALGYEDDPDNNP